MDKIRTPQAVEKIGKTWCTEMQGVMRMDFDEFVLHLQGALQSFFLAELFFLNLCQDLFRQRQYLFDFFPGNPCCRINHDIRGLHQQVYLAGMILLVARKLVKRLANFRCVGFIRRQLSINLFGDDFYLITIV